MPLVEKHPSNRHFIGLPIRRAAVRSLLLLSCARLVGGVISGLIVAFLIGTLIFAATNLEGLAQVPTTFKVMLWLPIIAAVLAIALIVLVARLWMRSEGPLVSRVHLTVLAIALLGLFPFMYYWGLLGFHY